MRILDELEREIERVAYAADAPRLRRRWWRPGALLVLLPLAAGTVAVAATTGILSGEPVRNEPYAKLDPRSGVGVNAGAGKLFALRAPDPDGGPAWGTRLVDTSRGLGCLQAGRVVDGKLGILGRDGAFGNDGKFHELGADVLETTYCQQPDAAGNVFIAVSSIGLPASGDARGCVARQRTGSKACPWGSLRDVFFGLLGPEAVAITYRDEKRLVRQDVTGPEGAYLVVRKTDPDRRNVGWWSPGLSPSWVESIEFRDGTVCDPKRQPRRNGVKGCPLKGYVTPRARLATRKELTSPVTVRVSEKPEKPRTPGTTAKALKRMPWHRRITITFHARRPADARAFYVIESELPRRGRACGGTMRSAIARDLRAGETVNETLWLPYRCRGTVTVRVGYEQPSKPTGMPFQAAGPPNAKVGTAKAQVR